jgi:hypothetical protein
LIIKFLVRSAEAVLVAWYAGFPQGGTEALVFPAAFPLGERREAATARGSPGAYLENAKGMSRLSRWRARGCRAPGEQLEIAGQPGASGQGR